jgi:hypothetical protein
MTVHQKANNLSYELVPETCPAIDEALEEFIDVIRGFVTCEEMNVILEALYHADRKIKAETILFRRALKEMCKRALKAEKDLKGFAAKANLSTRKFIRYVDAE